MDFLHLANELIPNYRTLPEHIRTAFENTAAGKELTQAVNQLNTILNPGFFTQRFQLPFLSDVSPEEEIEEAKTALQNQINTSEDYQELVRKINLIATIQKEIQKHFNKFYLKQLRTACQHHINILNLEQFNTAHAKTLAKKILSVDEWIEQYETSLLEYIKKNISLINGTNPFPNPPLFSKKNAIHSLSNLYSYMCSVHKKQREVKWCVDKVYEAADAHAFLQATGFATQNETSWLAGFDIINYFRIAGNLAEVKTMLSKLIQPFAPLYLEYSSLNREQHIVRQIVRTVMPMLILSAAVILVSVLLSSFVIPEIAFFFILLPTLYLGLVAASSYVVIKNLIYNNLHQRWFGGQFEIPEYQVSNSMLMSFGNAEKAQKIRDFYVDEIKTCFTKEKNYQTQIRLSQVEQKNRQLISERARALQLEWYDIHSNPTLSTNVTIEIVLNRLELDGKIACNAMQTELNNELETNISAVVHNVSEEIRASIEPILPPRQISFFKPACFKHRETVERLHTLKEEIQVAGVPMALH